MFIKISVVVNTLLFGVTGAIYLSRGSNIIGYILLAAGFMNVMYLLFSMSTKNIFFVILNFIFAAVSLLVCIDYIRTDRSTFALIWMGITLIYLVVAFILLMRLNKGKKKPEMSDNQGL
ncbi:MAG: hypothetical protein KDC05_13455 [Bacteroidales bacterium]|nr:hypothetical protein [Bacteroidales bacterium]